MLRAWSEASSQQSRASPRQTTPNTNTRPKPKPRFLNYDEEKFRIAFPRYVSSLVYLEEIREVWSFAKNECQDEIGVLTEMTPILSVISNVCHFAVFVISIADTGQTSNPSLQRRKSRHRFKDASLGTDSGHVEAAVFANGTLHHPYNRIFFIRPLLFAQLLILLHKGAFHGGRRRGT